MGVFIFAALLARFLQVRGSPFSRGLAMSLPGRLVLLVHTLHGYFLFLSQYGLLHFGQMRTSAPRGVHSWPQRLHFNV